MNPMALLGICFLLGQVARRTPSVPRETPRVLSWWIISVSLPALVLHSLHGVEWSASLVVGAVVLWLIFVLSAASVTILVRVKWLTVPKAGALGLCAGLGNTAFVGLPMIEAMYGPQGVGPAAFVDQAGSFVALSLLAVPFSAMLGQGSLRFVDIVNRVLRFPPTIALVLALLLRSFEFSYWLDSVLLRLADMLSPLALTVIGWNFSPAGLFGSGKHILLGLSYKLLLAPVLMFGILAAVFGTLGLREQVIVSQAGMAPMLTASVLAAEQKFDAPLASALVTVGVAVSFLTVPLFQWLVFGSRWL
jgi:malate permease and related proteins